MEELISVIVAIYNSELALEKMLKCVFNQTYKNLEIILVDDGSTDSSGNICDKFAEQDSRCKVIHKRNEGQCAAKNAGQAIATGEYIFFPDSDDTFNLDIIRILHEAIKRNPEYDLALCRRDMVNNWDTDNTPLMRGFEDLPSVEYSKDDLFQGLFCRNDDRFLYCWNKLYRKKLLNDLWYENYTRHGDFDFNFRVFLRTRKAIYIDVPLYHWVQWGGSKTHQSDTWDFYYNCRTTILFNNWTQLTLKDNRYEHYLLDALYKTMVFWEEWSRKSGNFPEIKASCGVYQMKTKKAYLKARQINPLMKATCLALLKFPRLSHVIMRLTSNAR